MRYYVNILLTAVDISHFYITWKASEQFRRRDLKPMAFLVFVTIRNRKFHLYVQLLYKKISYLCKNTHLRKDAAFLHFRFKESSENMTFPWNEKNTKPNENMTFSVLFTNFCKTKVLFSMQCWWCIYSSRWRDK